MYICYAPRMCEKIKAMIRLYDEKTFRSYLFVLNCITE